MNERERLTEPFEESRAHLRAVAYRMLGSLSEAEDAVQEAWLRLNRADTSGVDNLKGWLTTVVARVCLDMLRSRKSRREESMEIGEPIPDHAPAADPEREAVLADSVGLALLVVLEKLTPAERLAFVLHDMFAVSFDEIAPIVGRSPEAARQLASRARRRVRGAEPSGPADLAAQREVVDAFLGALRAGDFEGLVAVLDPDVVFRADRAAGHGGPIEIRGAREWAKGAITYSQAVRHAQPAIIDGSLGLVLAPLGHLTRALRVGITGGKIAEVEVIADPATLRELDVSVLDDSGGPREIRG